MSELSKNKSEITESAVKADMEFNTPIKSIKDQCIDIATKNLPGDSTINPTNQIEYIFAHAATNKDFGKVLVSEDKRVQAELKSQIKYICSLGIDAAKGKKLVYVKTRNVNVGDQNNKIWLTMPDISESYHAVILILVRSSILKNIVVQHTYSGYTVEYTGMVSDVPIIKSWMVSPADRGEYTGCFVTLYLPDGTIQTSYHHAADINATHKAFSKSGATWKNHMLAMTAKSALMDAMRYIPKSNDVVSSIVENYDDSHEFDEPENIKVEKISNEDVEWIFSAIKEKGINIDSFERFLNKNRLKKVEDINTKFFETVKDMINNYVKKEESDAE